MMVGPKSTQTRVVGIIIDDIATSLIYGVCGTSLLIESTDSMIWSN